MSRVRSVLTLFAQIPRSGHRLWRYGSRALLLSVAAASAMAAEREVITLASDPWPPFVEGKVGSEATGGLAVDLLNAIFGRIEGVEFRVPLLPWKRVLAEVERGTKDGIAMLLKTPERERYMRYTDPLITSRNLVWYSTRRFPDGFRWSTLIELKPYRLGSTRGYSYGEDVDRAIESGTYNVIQVRNVEQLFQMLSRDRLDLALANEAVGRALIRDLAGAAQIVPASMPTNVETHFLALSRASGASRLIPQINQVLADLRAEGFLDRLIGRE